MKKILVLLILLTGAYASFSQEVKKEEEIIVQVKPISELSNNEIRINVPSAIAGLPELTYERTFADNMGAGISIAFQLEKFKDNHTNGLNELRSLICPFYRLYFGEKEASGFYVEGNMAIAGQKEKYNSYDFNGNVSSSYERSATNFGFGAAVGIKLLARNGFIGDFYAGWGRLFGDNIIGGYPRLGICIGKRF